MGDEKDESVTKNKNDGFFFIKFLMFILFNYIVWVMRMKIVFKVNKVWEVIDFGNKIEEKNDMVIVLIF